MTVRLSSNLRDGVRDPNSLRPWHFTEICCGAEAGSYLRLIDSCITQLKAQGPSRTCNASNQEDLGAGLPDLGGVVAEVGQEDHSG